MSVVKKKIANNNIFQFPGGGLGSQNPARTIAHSPLKVEETLTYWLRGKKNILIPGVQTSIFRKKKRFFGSEKTKIIF